jgi:hypothetical protein
MKATKEKAAQSLLEIVLYMYNEHLPEDGDTYHDFLQDLRQRCLAVVDGEMPLNVFPVSPCGKDLVPVTVCAFMDAFR